MLIYSVNSYCICYTNYTLARDHLNLSAKMAERKPSIALVLVKVSAVLHKPVRR